MIGRQIEKLQKIKTLKEKYIHLDHNRKRYESMIKQMIIGGLCEEVINLHKEKIKEIKENMKEVADVIIFEML